MDKLTQQQIWDSIAESWHAFRRRPLKIVARLAKEWKRGKIVDIGCGNCRNLLPFAQVGFDCYGVDFSSKMLKLADQFCKQHSISVELRLAKADRLPFASWDFDYCLSIATLHHIEDAESRKTALFELRRVLKPGCQALIIVWNKLQLPFIFRKKDTFVRWRVGKKTYHRYYHFFTYWELRKLLKQCEFEIDHSGGPFGRNLIFIVRKPKA